MLDAINSPKPFYVCSTTTRKGRDGTASDRAPIPPDLGLKFFGGIMDVPKNFREVKVFVQENNTVNLLVCERCGALVFAPLSHEMWHKQLRIDLDG
jgi:hypothetical protein